MRQEQVVALRDHEFSLLLERQIEEIILTEHSEIPSNNPILTGKIKPCPIIFEILILNEEQKL